MGQEGGTASSSGSVRGTAFLYGQGRGTASLYGPGKRYCLLEWVRKGVLPLRGGQ